MKKVIDRLSLRTKVEICAILGYMAYVVIGITIMAATH